MKAKAHKILGKSEIMQMDYVNFVLEAAASGCRFGLIHEKQPGGTYSVRAAPNACMVLPPGSGKSTVIGGLRNEFCIRANDITFPGLIGSISKEGEFLPGSIIKSAGKLLLIDEFQRMDDTVKNAMNSLLEYPHTYTRNLGFHVKRPYASGKKGWYSVKAKDGEISLFCRFSCIASGMYISKKNTVQNAWFTRFIPIVMRPSLDWYQKLTIGEKTICINPHIREGDFEFRNFDEFHREYWRSLKGHEFFLAYFKKFAQDGGYTARNFQDVARLACFVCSLDGRSLVKRSDWQEAMKMRDIMLFNGILTVLTEVQQAILEHPEMSNNELAELTATTPENVIQRRRELAGLLEYRLNPPKK